MKTKDDDKLASLVRMYGATEPTDEFSSDLLQAIVKQQQTKLEKKKESNSWAAALIMGLALILNLVFLVELNPFAINPALYISVSCFIFGFWCITILYHKALELKLNRSHQSDLPG